MDTLLSTIDIVVSPWLAVLDRSLFSADIDLLGYACWIRHDVVARRKQLQPAFP